MIGHPEDRGVPSRSWAAPVSCDLVGIDAQIIFRRLSIRNDFLCFFHSWPFAGVLHILGSCWILSVLASVSDVARQCCFVRAYADLFREVAGCN